MHWLVSFLLGLVFLATCSIWIVAIIASYRVQNYLDIEEIIIDEEITKEFKPLLAEALKNMEPVKIHPFAELPKVKASNEFPIIKVSN
ncbi:hypothetical protein [Acinetobacter beijerinckii]|uniref:hypothetical protein n=1 Tax=Acinetobacter beijerinckii TaxID=262668 RepID=UPI003AF63EF8